MMHQNKNGLIKIALVEDHSLVRQAFKNYISQYDEFSVVFDTDDGALLLRDLKSKILDIDVLVLDLFSPRTDGRDILKEISNLYPSIHTIFLSGCTDIKTIGLLFDMGAYAYVSKNSEPEELYEAIKSAANGEVYKNQFYYSRQSIMLNPTEIMILKLVWLEKTSEEISRITYMSVSTIEKIKYQLKVKTNTKTTLGLIKYALERRILIPGME